MPTKGNWESVSSAETIFPLKKWKQTISCRGQKAKKPTKTTVKCSANNATAEKVISRRKGREEKEKRRNDNFLLFNGGTWNYSLLRLQKYNEIFY